MTAGAWCALAAGVGWGLALHTGAAYLRTRRKYRDLEECFDESDAERMQLRAYVDRQLLKQHHAGVDAELKRRRNRPLGLS